MRLYCCSCGKEVEACLVKGDKIYPHRPDLYKKNFYQCPKCGQYVGCHKDTTRPMGCIPSEAVKIGRKKIHAILDPIWKSGKLTRKEIYKRISDRLGYTYHTGETKSVSECMLVYDIVMEIREEIYS